MRCGGQGRKSATWTTGTTNGDQEGRAVTEVAIGICLETKARGLIQMSGIDAACSANQRADEDCCSAQRGGLRDEEVEEFLRSRAKRGRGSVGSRMDEPGPYLPHLAGSEYVILVRSSDQDREQRRARVLGPEKSSSLNLYEASSEDEHHDRKKSKKWSSRSSSKHSKKHKSRDECRDKKKKRKY